MSEHLNHLSACERRAVAREVVTDLTVALSSKNISTTIAQHLRPLKISVFRHFLFREIILLQAIMHSLKAGNAIRFYHDAPSMFSPIVRVFAT